MTRKKKMLVIGLTGGIGTGKSTAARILNGFGLPIYSADQAVHDLLAKGGKAVKPVTRLFPESLKRGAIDRKILGPLVFGKPDKLKRLEAVLHPLVHKAEAVFLKQARRDGAAAAILEIPLLFETGAQKRCDFVICVTAPRAVQKERVLRRAGMTEAKFNAILRHQMKDAARRERADHVVPTQGGHADTKKRLARILNHHQLIRDADA